MSDEPQGTGDCFEVSFNLMYFLNNDCILCHGKVSGQGPIEGERISHSWIELNGFVIDKSNGHSYINTIEEYYKLGKVKLEEVTKYTHIEALKKVVKYKHYGPWK